MQHLLAKTPSTKSALPVDRLILRGLLSTLALFATSLLIFWSAPAHAQQTGSAAVRTAGSDTNFRVISRFPDEKPADPPLSDTEKTQVDDSIRDAIAEKRWKVAGLLLAHATGEASEAKDTQAKDAKAKDAKLKKDADPYLTLLSGYLSLQAGDFDIAMSRLDSVAKKVAILEDYRLFWAAESALGAKKPHEAVLYAAGVPRESRLFGQSLILLAGALAQSDTDSDLERAIKTLEVYLQKYPNGRSAPSARLLLAESLEKSEKWELAGKTYYEIEEKDALTPAAATAATRLGVIRKHLSKELRDAVEKPSIEHRMYRWRALYNQHQSDTLIQELTSALGEMKANDDKAKATRCEALYLVAQSHTKLRHHADGAAWYQRVLKECPDTSYEIKTLYVGGKGFWNAGEKDAAKDWFARIAKNFPEHSFADDAMYFTARILGEQGQTDAARAMLKKQVERYPTGDMAKDARWLLVREMFTNSAYQDVVDYIDGLSETGEDDLYTRGRLAYFRARALEKLAADAKSGAEKPNLAEKAYREVVQANPLSYYAYLALNRLGLMAAQAAGEKDAPSTHDPRISDLCAMKGATLCNFINPKSSEKVEIDRSLREAAPFQKGQALLSLGLVEIAESEFQALRRNHASPDNLWAMTYLLDAAHAYRVSHDLPRRHIDGWETDYPHGKSDPHWSLAFPHPFADLVDKYAHQREIPSAIVYAIMREESGYNPLIESWANARGLLQLMEATARSIAAEDGFQNFSAPQLFDPEVNIRLGTAYIAQLGEQLNAHPALMIAGYNGGFTNVSRWLKERGELPLDLWVEDIPYGQTRNYTKRVLSSFWTYAWLYGRDRVPPIDFALPAVK